MYVLLLKNRIESTLKTILLRKMLLIAELKTCLVIFLLKLGCKEIDLRFLINFLFTYHNVKLVLATERREGNTLFVTCELYVKQLQLTDSSNTLNETSNIIHTHNHPDNEHCSFTKRLQGMIVHRWRYLNGTMQQSLQYDVTI